MKAKILALDQKTKARLENQLDMKRYHLVSESSRDISLAVMDIVDKTGFPSPDLITKIGSNIPTIVYTDAPELWCGIPCRARGAKGFLNLEEDLPKAIDSIISGQEYFDSSILYFKKEPDLFPRKKEILHYIGQGSTINEIAQRLGISVKTAAIHLALIKDTFNLTCLRTPAAVWAYSYHCNPSDAWSGVHGFSNLSRSEKMVFQKYGNSEYEENSGAIALSENSRPRTIDCHRLNGRHKLGLNLQKYTMLSALYNAGLVPEYIKKEI